MNAINLTASSYNILKDIIGDKDRDEFTQMSQTP